jgi:hypothetical protein
LAFYLAATYLIGGPFGPELQRPIPCGPSLAYNLYTKFLIEIKNLAIFSDKVFLGLRSVIKNPTPKFKFVFFLKGIVESYADNKIPILHKIEMLEPDKSKTNITLFILRKWSNKTHPTRFFLERKEAKHEHSITVTSSDKKEIKKLS